MADVLKFTGENFKSEVLDSGIPVLVDFWAPWCGPCRMIAPVVDELAAELSGKLKVGKVNTDENTQLAGEYGVMSIPTLIVFKDGEAAERLVGFMNKKDLQTAIDKVIG